MPFKAMVHSSITECTFADPLPPWAQLRGATPCHHDILPVPWRAVGLDDFIAVYQRAQDGGGAELGAKARASLPLVTESARACIYYSS